MAWSYLTQLREGGLRLSTSARESLEKLVDLHWEAVRPMVIAVDGILNRNAPVIATLAPELAAPDGVRNLGLEALVEQLSNIRERPELGGWALGNPDPHYPSVLEAAHNFRWLRGDLREPRRWGYALDRLQMCPTLHELLSELQAWAVASTHTGAISQARLEAAAETRHGRPQRRSAAVLARLTQT